MTPGFRLPAKHVIHVLGPVGGEQPQILRAAYRRCLSLMVEHGFRSLVLATPLQRRSCRRLPLTHKSRIAAGIRVHLDWQVWLSDRYGRTYNSRSLCCTYSSASLCACAVDATHVALEAVRSWMEENLEFVGTVRTLVYSLAVRVPARSDSLSISADRSAHLLRQGAHQRGSVRAADGRLLSTAVSGTMARRW